MHYVILLPPAAERRVRQVADRAGHGFTDEDATRHVHREFVRGEIDQRHALTDLADAEGVTADILARLDAGTLRYS